MTETMIHEQRARELAAEPAASTALSCARQGDLMMRRIGEATATKGEPTPDGGVVVAAGQHGEHRLVSDAVVWHETDEQPVVEVLGRAVVVHTDVPAARHGSIELAPGRWEYSRLRELAPGETLEQEVQD